LANRPSVEELKQQNIVLTTVQAKAQALQHAQTGGTAGLVVHRKPAAHSSSAVPSVSNSSIGESSAVKPFPLWLLVPILGIILLMFFKID
jgi:hypothetical protein